MRWGIFLLLLCGMSLPPATQAGSGETGRGGAGPLIYWTGGVGTIGAVKTAGVIELAVPATEVAAWRKAGLRVVGIKGQELARRRKVSVPRLAGRGNVASATRRPWIDANGWVFTRYPAERFIYDQLPAGKAPLAAAEAFAYGADALLRIAPEDLRLAATTIDYLRRLPVMSFPVVADFTVVDNNAAQIDEVLNLLTRRNLLYRIVPSPVLSYPINIRLGTKEYPEAEAADPSAFAQAIRLKIGDENRSLRIYGSEIIIGRLTGDGTRGRLHLLNYSGRPAEGLRIRVRGNYHSGTLATLGVDGQTLDEPLVGNGIYEGTIPRMEAYAIIDLR